MLPNVSGLRLDGRPLVTTGEFWPLSADEVVERNAGGDHESFTTDPFQEDTEPVDGWHTFRVRAEYPRPDGTYDYSYYRGESLWEYMKRGNKRDPLTRGPLWYEDYMDLHAKFAPHEPLHPWVTSLRRRPSAPAPAAPQVPSFAPSAGALQELGVEGPPPVITLPPLREQLQTALRLANAPPMAFSLAMSWNRWRGMTGGVGDTPQPAPDAMSLTGPQSDVLRTPTARMTELVTQYAYHASTRSLGRAEDMRRAQEAFVISPATAYEAAYFLRWYADLFSVSDGAGYHTARKGLFNMMHAFTLTMNGTGVRNAAFELRILQYLSALSSLSNDLWAWIERGEGFMESPPVLDDFRTQLNRYISEHMNATTNNNDAGASETTPDVLPVVRQMGQLALDQPPAEIPVPTVANTHINAMVQRQEDHLLGVGNLGNTRHNEIYESFRVLLARWYQWLPHIMNNLRRLVVVTCNMLLTGMGYQLKDLVLQFLVLAGNADPELNTYIRERRDYSSFLPSVLNHLNSAQRRGESNSPGAAAAQVLVNRFS